MKQEFTRQEVIGLFKELLARPDLLIDAVQNENTNHDADSLIGLAEGFISESDKHSRIDKWREKAGKWDALEIKIRGYYFDDNAEEIEDEKLDNGMVLLDIGEDAARAFGFM